MAARPRRGFERRSSSPINLADIFTHLGESSCGRHPALIWPCLVSKTVGGIKELGRCANPLSFHVPFFSGLDRYISRRRFSFGTFKFRVAGLNRRPECIVFRFRNVDDVSHRNISRPSLLYAHQLCKHVQRANKSQERERSRYLLQVFIMLCVACL